ncbi:DUF3592 domain-containing protein [Archangium lansingense]|uniref:DUF3592 domain-containing protein n=1 Tax=Archangium lansingense TaxID=2995310 RepID=A0ABT4APK3_9BACT|nr:DUF3592 domain-containing protein [Archangium lansinium]MCY1083089.1 DUF3592 domain-containing protein [Archangium lansinium]
MGALNAVLVLFLLAWSALTLVFDGVILYGITRQTLARSYPHVPGTITHSQVVKNSDSDGTTYRFEVRYSYEVNGQRYEGTRYRYSAWGSSSSSPSAEAARHFTVGATVPVFHHPEAPGDAVLLTGVQGMDLFLLLFMNPFNLVMLAGWYGAVYSLRKKDEGVGAFMRDGRVHVRLDGMSAGAAGVLAFGGASFLSIFVVAFATGANPSMVTAVLTWVAVIAAGVYFARRQRVKLDSGAYDLIVDEPNRRLSLPVGPDRVDRLDVPWGQVKSFLVESRTKKDGDGDPVTVWCPTVVLTVSQGEYRNEALVEWNDEDKATFLVKWLEERLTPLRKRR